ncbi:CHAT domain-containing protein [Microbacterium sp. NPDC076911]|uniref:CHAT domain-containing protein n=1 Tax=Microbacterium sp. NPDC076911 TaxID=3154958 RepID=UPI003431D845
MGLSATELYARGVEHGNAGRNAAARRDLLLARARTSDPDLRARAAGTLAYIASRTGDPAAAEVLCREAMADRGVGEETQAILYGQLGVLALMRGENAAARALLTTALAGMPAQNAEDHARVGRMRLNRSVASMLAGDLNAARDDLRRAASIFADLGEPVERAKALHNLGYVELLAGDLVAALAHMETARPTFEQESPVAAAQSDLDRAEVLRDAGLTTEAEQILARVARVFGAHRMRQARAETELGLARSRLMLDPGGAMRLARVAARRFRSLGSDTWALRAEATEVRAALAPGVSAAPGDRRTVSRSDEAMERAPALAADLDGAGLTSSATAVRLAADLRAEDNAGVAPVARRSIRVRRDASLANRLLADQVRARRAENDGDLAAVRRHAAHGLDELLRRQSTFGSLDLRTSAAVHARPLIVTGLRAAVASGRADVLFEWSERARHLNQSVVPLRPPPDVELAADLAELRQIRQEASGDSWLSNPRAEVLRDRVRERQWRDMRGTEVERHTTLSALRADLDADTAVLAYVWSGEALTCVVVTAVGTRIIHVSEWPNARALMAGLRADLDVSATLVPGPMASIVHRSLHERLEALSRALLDAAVHAAGTRRLVITAPGVLSGIPWGMLPGLRGRAFTLATSATSWLNCRRKVIRPGVGFVAGPRVPRAREEVERSRAVRGGAHLLMGDDATVDAVTALAARTGTLHVAAHGRHAIDNPMFSGLELADGALFGYDIDLIPVVPDLVVLSACEVGRSSVRWGEEAIGMTRIWLHAGARCVIATPVIVADDDACELLGSMHEQLAAGLPPAEALAAASDKSGIIAPFQAHGAGL